MSPTVSVRMIQPAVSRLTISQPMRLSAARSHTRATERELGHFIGPYCPGGRRRSQTDARSEATEEALGIVEEGARDADVLDLAVVDGRDRLALEQQDLGPRQRHQDRRVGGDDELAILGRAVAQDREQRQHADRRERSLRLVEEVEAARLQPLLEQVQERLAVRARVGIRPVAPDQSRALPRGGAGGEPLAPRALAQGAPQLVLHLAEPLDVAPARGDRPRPGGYPLEQGRLAAAVLPHQEGDARPEIEPLQDPEERDRERKAIGLPQAAGAADPGEEDPRRQRRLAGARPLHAVRGPATGAARGSPRAVARRGP